MDITSFVVQGRDQALLYGDYSTYHALLSKRVLSSRKKLGIATKNRGKFQKRDPIKAEDVAQNHENVNLLLLTSERAWAQAMSMKSGHTANQRNVQGRTRSHVVSRLEKAARAAEHLVDILNETAVSGATTNDVLEARAYASLIRGAMQFEKQTWEPCVRSYAVSRIVYSALATTYKGDIFKDLLSETIDPSIRYAAYRLNTPRTVPIPAVALKAFPHDDKALVKDINKVDPNALKEGGAGAAKNPSDIPRTLTWRSREVQIEDAQIAEAWAVVQHAKTQLADKIASSKGKDAHDIAGAYDEILTATQDAVDATKQAIDELKSEGVSQGDARMQSLQVTRTAVNYEMISWRIGRNRVLTGPHDGATEEYGPLRRGRMAKAADSVTAVQEKELPPSRKLAKLKEKAALYDGTLQNLQSIKELPGVAADEMLATKLEAYQGYFQALKSLAIARSHAIIGKVANALGLIQHSSKLCEQSTSKFRKAASTDSTDSPPLHVDVAGSAIEFLRNLLNGELQRHRAMVHIDNLRKADKENAPEAGSSAPLIERLHEYPAEVDLANVVEFPPKMALIPMKPVLLDVAWNYIAYPGETPHAAAVAPAAGKSETVQQSQEQQQPQQQQQQKRGWFGFGRS